jgi:hypothetical protein
MLFFKKLKNHTRFIAGQVNLLTAKTLQAKRLGNQIKYTEKINMFRAVYLTKAYLLCRFALPPILYSSARIIRNSLSQSKFPVEFPYTLFLN